MARVTVVNDNPEFLELMGEVFESERYETTTIDGDQQGVLELVRASKPDVLVLDLRMGSEGLHGWNVAQELRQDPELEDLPVLLTSADLHALQEVETHLEAERAVELLPKPFGIDELTAAVERLLTQARVV
jgi:CheY-like chemotaxis protein